jgi:hypothetical protein
VSIDNDPTIVVCSMTIKLGSPGRSVVSREIDL